MLASTFRVIRRAYDIVTPWGALVPAALFVALDIGDVAGDPAWTVLAYAFLGVFALLLVMENHKLRQLTARDRQAGALIEELTSLSTEGARLSQHPGSGGGITFYAPGMEDSPRQRERDKQRRDYEALSIEWGQKVRTKLDGRGREFLADWEAAEIEDRYELLRNIIRELRGRL